jgi:hypothetical protein
LEFKIKRLDEKESELLKELNDVKNQSLIIQKKLDAWKV